MGESVWLVCVPPRAFKWLEGSGALKWWGVSAGGMGPTAATYGGGETK